MLSWHSMVMLVLVGMNRMSKLKPPTNIRTTSVKCCMTSKYLVNNEEDEVACQRDFRYSYHAGDMIDLINIVCDGYKATDSGYSERVLQRFVHIKE
jgi:hypothetical protein